MRSLLYFFLCGSCIANSTTWAATQGTIGQTSIGSVSISVHIPHTVRLIAKETSNSILDNTNKYCLRVIDTNITNGPNYYRVNSIGKTYKLRLQNLYRLSEDDIPRCTDNNILTTSNVSNDRDTQFTVLMLVPE